MGDSRSRGCGPVALTVGEAPPAISISWVKPKKRWDGGFLILFSEFDPDRDDDPTPTLLVCLHCLIRDGDQQLGRGLDLTREHGRVDWDPDHGEWFMPLDTGRPKP